ncbi:hypothetical protein QCA50_009734 [Cerrena zonata]|uniref:Uncharacterized protein n=1 Tax=Cerrena zonata TaxID=2478898 RepID=A0AAW0G762_9APHY
MDICTFLVRYYDAFRQFVSTHNTTSLLIKQPSVTFENRIMVETEEGSFLLATFPYLIEIPSPHFPLSRSHGVTRDCGFNTILPSLARSLFLVSLAIDGDITEQTWIALAGITNPTQTTAPLRHHCLVSAPLVENNNRRYHLAPDLSDSRLQVVCHHAVPRPSVVISPMIFHKHWIRITWLFSVLSTNKQRSDFSPFLTLLEMQLILFQLNVVC